MSNETIKDLLIRVCEAYVREEDYWRSTYGIGFHDVTPEQEAEYSSILENTRKTFYDVGEKLNQIGYPVYYYYITGIANNDWSHHELDRVIEEEFGDQVDGDSESGQFFLDVTTLPMAKKVLERVKEIAGPNFELRSIVEAHGKPRIRGIYNWDAARTLLQKLS